jgi:hypothetical protein
MAALQTATAGLEAGPGYPRRNDVAYAATAGQHHTGSATLPLLHSHTCVGLQPKLSRHGEICIRTLPWPGLLQ